MGRDPLGTAPPRWLLGGWIGLGFLYIAMAVIQARTPERDGFPWFNLFIGVFWILYGAALYGICRHRRAKERSAQTQVEHGAEPGRPGAGG